MVMRLLLLLQVLLLAMPAHAARLVLAVEQSEVVVGDDVAVVLTVLDQEVADVPQLSLPTGLQASFSSRTTAFKLIDASTSLSMRFTYRVVGREVGEYTIGPLVLEVDGQPLSSNSVPLKVVPPAVSPDAGAAEVPDASAEGNKKP